MTNTIVLATGGIGTRMMPLTKNKQKCMLEVCGRPILEHILENINNAFPSYITILSERYCQQDVKDYFKDKYKSLNLIHSDIPNLIGEKNSFLRVKNYINGPFFWHDGDVLCKIEYLRLLRKTVEEENNNYYAVVMGAVDGSVASTHAKIEIDDDVVIKKFIQSKNLTVSDKSKNLLTMMDIAYYSDEFYTDLKNSPVEYTSHYDVIEEQVNKNGKKIKVITYPDKWYHFVTPDDLNIAGLFPQKLPCIS